MGIIVGWGLLYRAVVFWTVLEETTGILRDQDRVIDDDDNWLLAAVLEKRIESLGTRKRISPTEYILTLIDHAPPHCSATLSHPH